MSKKYQQPLFAFLAPPLGDADLEMTPAEFASKASLAGIAFALLCAAAAYAAGASGVILLAAICAFLSVWVVAYILVLYIGYVRLRTIEELLPEFLSLMASNIRSGLTPDRAMMVSARKEFGPLTKMIEKAAKDVITGKPLDIALSDMVKLARSEAFSKSMKLIVEGIRSGGELEGLLENASLDMRRFAYLRKEVASTVLVYELFMFSASAFGAPMLYGVTNFLLGVVSSLRSKMNFDPGALASSSMLVGSGTTQLDPGSVFIFSLVAIFVTVLFGCMAAGIITKGREIEGMKYVPPLLLIAYGIFFASISALQILFSKMFHF